MNQNNIQSNQQLTPLGINIYKQNKEVPVSTVTAVAAPAERQKAQVTIGGSFHERNQKWVEETKNKREKALRNSSSYEMKECTFKPIVISKDIA